MSDRIKKLDEKVAAVWASILDNSRFVKLVREGQCDKQLYAMYMLETFHYTKHNARNQAIVGALMPESGDRARSAQYQKFCFEHAMEETGHELMALHDVLSLGLAKEDVRPGRPLPATEVLIAYLYWISAQGNPVQRLGYSFWAENCYTYINPIIEQIRSTLGLKASQMTFFIAHSAIDKDHAEEVQKMLVDHCRTDQDWEDVETVMETSLRLTGNLLEDVYWEYRRLSAGEPSRYSYLKKL